MVVQCLQCNADVRTYPSRIKRGNSKFCSYRCAGDAKKGKINYIRTEEHKKRMSAKILSLDMSGNRDRFIKMNAARKGKDFTEIYGDRADEIRAKYGKFGQENHNWRGGKKRQGYPYDFFQKREMVKSRDGYECRICGITEKEVKEKDSLDRGLAIHHIDYNKDNNSLSNLITACRWCNSRANGRNTDWEGLCRSLLGA